MQKKRSGSESMSSKVKEKFPRNGTGMISMMNEHISEFQIL